MVQAHTARPQHYTLRGIAIFATLSANALACIQRRCSWRRYERGEPIVNYLDPSDEVFFITAGEAHGCVSFEVFWRASGWYWQAGDGEAVGPFTINNKAYKNASLHSRRRQSPRSQD